MSKHPVADLMVACLENEGVEFVFGLPGEENIALVEALSHSKKIRYVLVRHEQGASFMADIYGRLTGRAGVCSSTLGPGAINLLLGTVDAQTDSAPLVALVAQVGLNRIYKESHQIVDLEGMFKPVVKWANTVMTVDAIPEMIRKAFVTAQSERPGAAFLAVPQDIETAQQGGDLKPLALAIDVGRSVADPDQIESAAERIRRARCPIVLAGHGVVRARAAGALAAFVEATHIPVATTFMAKGVLSSRHSHCLGAVGFMRPDYVNQAFEEADLIISVGFEFQEFAPLRINPKKDKEFVHVHGIEAECDAAYNVKHSLVGDVGVSLEQLASHFKKPFATSKVVGKVREQLQTECDAGAEDTAFPLKPQRIVSDVRRAMGDDDITLVDTGAGKMWFSRLYPTYAPNTCLISNGLSTMAFALPGSMGAKLACPQRRVLAVNGDGAFMMNVQELETAVRERIPIAVLVLVDHAYGLIKWKMKMEIDTTPHVDFGNPDFASLAESFGARAFRVKRAEDLYPMLQQALAHDGVSVIACPMDGEENTRLTDRLAKLFGE